MTDHSHDTRDARRLALASLPWLAVPTGDGYIAERRAALLWCEDCQVSHEFDAVAVTWSRKDDKR